MAQADITYYRRRLNEERLELGIARNSSTASVHRNLALLYETRLAALLVPRDDDRSWQNEPPCTTPDRTTWSALLARTFTVPSQNDELSRAPDAVPIQTAYLQAGR